MIKVLIADDHAIIRKGLKRIIQDQTDMMVVGEARDGLEALTMGQKDGWDVLVLDISMPLRSGMEVLQAMHCSKPHMPVLMLSVYPEEEYGLRVLKAGAAGFMTKTVALEELVPAIKKVVNGGKYVSTTLAEHLVQRIGGDFTKAPHERLSNREFDVLRLIGNGKSATEMAQLLVLSIKTISTYRTRILSKLGLKTNAELIRYTVEHSLL